VTGAFNFAHPIAFVVSGLVLAAVETKGSPVSIAILVAIAAGAIAGVVIDRVALWPARTWPHGALGSNRTIVTSVAALALAAALIVRGSTPVHLRPLPSLHAAGIVIDEHTFLTVCCALILIAAVALFGVSRIGLAMKAVAANATAARAAGVDVEWTITQSSLWGSKLAAIAGVATALSTHYVFALPAVFAAALCALAAAALGGLRSVPGTIVGAYVVAAAQVAASLVSPRFGSDPLLVVIILFAAIALAPRGLLPRRSLRST